MDKAIQQEKFNNINRLMTFCKATEKAHVAAVEAFNEQVSELIRSFAEDDMALKRYLDREKEFGMQVLSEIFSKCIIKGQKFDTCVLCSLSTARKYGRLLDLHMLKITNETDDSWLIDDDDDVA